MNDEEIKKEFQKVWAKVGELEGKIEDKHKDDKFLEISKDNPYLENEIKIFCKNSDIREERLKYEIDFQKEFPRLINLPKENVRTKLQFSVLILLAPIFYRIYKKDLSKSIIRNLFELNRIPLERMDKLYDSPTFKKFFSKSETNIKLSWAGEQEGVKRIKKLMENETNTSK